MCTHRRDRHYLCPGHHARLMVSKENLNRTQLPCPWAAVHAEAPRGRAWCRPERRAKALQVTTRRGERQAIIAMCGSLLRQTIRREEALTELVQRRKIQTGWSHPKAHSLPFLGSSEVPGSGYLGIGQTGLLSSEGDGQELEASAHPTRRDFPGWSSSPAGPAQWVQLTECPCPPSLSQAQKPVVWGTRRVDTDHPLFSVSLT